MDILVAVLVGAVAGWLAGLIMKSKKGGALFNIILGIVGGFFGNWVFKTLGISISSDLFGTFITSTIGAVLLLIIWRFVSKMR